MCFLRQPGSERRAEADLPIWNGPVGSLITILERSDISLSGIPHLSEVIAVGGEPTQVAVELDLGKGTDPGDISVPVERLVEPIASRWRPPRDLRERQGREILLARHEMVGGVEARIDFPPQEGLSDRDETRFVGDRWSLRA